jgi:hypothetical protein
MCGLTERRFGLGGTEADREHKGCSQTAAASYNAPSWRQPRNRRARPSRMRVSPGSFVWSASCGNSCLIRDYPRVSPADAQAIRAAFPNTGLARVLEGPEFLRFLDGEANLRWRAVQMPVMRVRTGAWLRVGDRRTRELVSSPVPALRRVKRRPGSWPAARCCWPMGGLGCGGAPGLCTHLPPIGRTRALHHGSATAAFRRDERCERGTATGSSILPLRRVT